jgi:hypothetical protein
MLTMWIIVNRPAPADAAYWPGRRWLAALDAVLWPAGWVIAVWQASVPTALVGQLVVACAVISGLRRLHRALWVNHRYRFSTWRWGRVVMALLLVGLLLKLSAMR